MNIKLKEEIIQLRKSGKTYREISIITGIADTTIRYNCDENYKSNAKQWSQDWRIKNPLKQKSQHYWQDDPNSKNFECEDVLAKFKENHYCYLTGTDIDFNDIDSYSLDHINPLALGGKSTIENMGLLRQDINKAKADKTIDQFIALCKEVLEYNGFEVIPNHKLERVRQLQD